MQRQRVRGEVERGQYLPFLAVDLIQTALALLRRDLSLSEGGKKPRACFVELF
ncbi:hypothetical protein SDC9_196619 [bioreactor metagenome]|uniref:Uncharacterized protein n=1 Tax=bioreactor metagenome TaxID=1076179 RepID=A0A645IDL2_9ZZZZ